MNPLPPAIKKEVLLSFAAANAPQYFVRKMLESKVSDSLLSRFSLEQLLNEVLTVDEASYPSAVDIAVANAALVSLLASGDLDVTNALKKREFSNLRWAKQIVSTLENRAQSVTNETVLSNAVPSSQPNSTFKTLHFASEADQQ